MANVTEMEAEAARLVEAGPEAERKALAALSGEARELLARSLASVRYRRSFEAADARLEENSDGTIIVKLTRPARVGSEDLHRLTVGRIKAKHVRQVTRAEGSLDDYADLIVIPEGATGELESEEDHVAVMRAVDRQLGKYLSGGARS